MEPMFYTVTDINGDYAQLMGDQGHEHSITMFLLPEGTTVGSRLKLGKTSSGLWKNKNSPAISAGLLLFFWTNSVRGRVRT